MSMNTITLYIYLAEYRRTALKYEHIIPKTAQILFSSCYLPDSDMGYGDEFIIFYFPSGGLS